MPWAEWSDGLPPLLLVLRPPAVTATATAVVAAPSGVAGSPEHHPPYPLTGGARDGVTPRSTDRPTGAGTPASR